METKELIILTALAQKLKLPLVDVLVQSKRLKKSTLTPEQSEYVQSIIKAGKQLLRLTERIYKKTTDFKLSNLPLATSPTAKASSANILLVEDSPFIQKIHTILLRELGHNVVVARNGKKALSLFNKYFDIILMDINLPDQSGIEVAEKIRQLEKNVVPIIMLTTEKDYGIKKVCEKAGANEFLTKPISKEKLDKTIRHWLQVKSLQPQIKQCNK